MDARFKNVPEEVAEVIDTGIFWIKYTHVTTDISRQGIEKTGKIMAPSIALGYDILPFNGEFLWFTYFFKHYHVSVSVYPPREHQWSNYIYGPVVWTPEGSSEWVMELEKIKQRIQARKPGLQEFLNPDSRIEPLMAIDECIELEERRRITYKQMTDEERGLLHTQKHEIYVFDNRLDRLLQRRVAYKEGHIEHPFAPGEIKLERYLVGMFTNRDVPETRSWISNLVGRSVPVASIDTLATWEEIFPRLPIFRDDPNDFSFYESLRKEEAVRGRIIKEVQEYCRRN